MRLCAAPLCGVHSWKHGDWRGSETGEAVTFCSTRDFVLLLTVFLMYVYCSARDYLSHKFPTISVEHSWNAGTDAVGKRSGTYHTSVMLYNYIYLLNKSKVMTCLSKINTSNTSINLRFAAKGFYPIICVF